MWPCTIPVVEEPVCEEKGGHHNHQIQKFAHHKTEKVHIVPEKQEKDQVSSVSLFEDVLSKIREVTGWSPPSFICIHIKNSDIVVPNIAAYHEWKQTYYDDIHTLFSVKKNH